MRGWVYLTPDERTEGLKGYKRGPGPLVLSVNDPGWALAIVRWHKRHWVDELQVAQYFLYLEHAVHSAAPEAQEPIRRIAAPVRVLRDAIESQFPDKSQQLFLGPLRHIGWSDHYGLWVLYRLMPKAIWRAEAYHARPDHMAVAAAESAAWLAVREAGGEGLTPDQAIEILGRLEVDCRDA
jgi:hypothetical protein